MTMMLMNMKTMKITNSAEIGTVQTREKIGKMLLTTLRIRVTNSKVMVGRRIKAPI